MTKIIINEKKHYEINKYMDWLIHMVAYAVILITMSLIFKKTIIIDNSYFGFWSLMAAIIIYFLNKTIKPTLIWLTLPLTGLTLGLFYPFVNVIILNIVDFMLGNHFTINGIWMAFVVAVLISIMNGIMNVFLVDPFVRRGK